MSLLQLRRRAGRDGTVHAKAARRIKSYRQPHDWQVTGTGRIQEFPTTSARCPRCGETADGFTAPLDRFLVIRAYGCAREGFNGTFERDDEVTLERGQNQPKVAAYFVNYLAGGRCALGDIAGNSYVVDLSAIKPELCRAD